MSHDRLKAKHSDTHISYQNKLGYVTSAHKSPENDKHATMGDRETRPQSRSAHDNAAVMVSVMDQLCTAITFKTSK